jgi:transcription elongation factor Elf1
MGLVTFAQIKLKLRCRHCGHSTTMTLDEWQRAHEVLCDHCDLPMACVSLDQKAESSAAPTGTPSTPAG